MKTGKFLLLHAFLVSLLKLKKRIEETAKKYKITKSDIVKNAVFFLCELIYYSPLFFHIFQKSFFYRILIFKIALMRLYRTLSQLKEGELFLLSAKISKF